MAIWTRTPDLEHLAKASANTAVSHMGIEYTEIGDDYVTGRMPVDERTVQPFGILHGGSSVVLAETLGSMAANWCLKDPDTVAVGLEINANHIRPVTQGWVYGTARPIHIGSATQVWEIRMENEAGKTTCISRLTMAVTRRP
ncbi:MULTISPECIES: hotdog fold thioesterase [unclassified Marinobacter]|uniref:hotdog fold thioesterase n=1 Tax=unclassified Marinobacter TaxID=83889 RepID=UPI0026E2224D|nr:MULTISPECIES: hotdog fold thioesterase [unclassified Marinobacter]MDO6443323.1 hotdog fold thioesterase [Marinobacter sp. 2_MG-2023]MDO6824279.1 hotdog fold thioesterase [Marinobacter sp. 1_MG-2023]